MDEPTKTSPTLCVVETLGFLEENDRREGEIIARTLRLSGKKVQYVYIRSRAEFVTFAEEFGESSHRYLHISGHANKKGFQTTTDWLRNEELAAILGPHLAKRRLFMSACKAARGS